MNRHGGVLYGFGRARLVINQSLEAKAKTQSGHAARRAREKYTYLFRKLALSKFANSLQRFSH